MLIRLIAATASVALMAGVASAQPASTSDVASQPSPSSSVAPAAVNPAPSDTTGYNARGAADRSADTAVPVSSAVLGDATSAKAGDTGVVSNGPVPDTPENRAKYGPCACAVQRRPR